MPLWSAPGLRAGAAAAMVGGVLWTAVALLGGGSGASPGLAETTVACAPDAGVTVCALPVDQTVTAGTTITVDVVVDDVTNLGGFEVTLAFDPALIAYSSHTYGTFLASTGRTPNCFSATLSSGSAGFSCVTTASPPPGPAGASGSGVLVNVRFTALAPGTTALAFSGSTLSTVDATAIPHATQGAQASITPAYTPTPCGGPCPTSTVTPTRTPTPTPGLGTVVRIDPPAQTVLPGDTFIVDVFIDDVANLASYEFTLAWDYTKVDFVSVSDGTFLGSSGRSVFCPGGIEGTNTLQFGCVTNGSSPPGASGSGQLAQVTFTAFSPSITATALDLFDVGLSEPLGTSISASVVDGTVTVQAPPTATPTPCTGACPTSTITPTRTATPTATPIPPTPPCPVGAGTRVCVDPPAQTVGIPATFPVDLKVSDVTNLGGYQFTLFFDPAIVSYVSVTNGPFLGSNGRQVTCFTPTTTANSVSFNCVTLGDEPSTGPSGNGILATVTFSSVAAGISPLFLQGVILTTPQGIQIPATDYDGLVEVVSGPTPTPTNTPTQGPTATPTSTPPPPTTVTRVIPASQTVSQGANFSVDITVESVSNLASYEWELSWDPAKVDYVSVANGPFLGSTGRSVFCPSPIIGPSSVRFGCATIGLTPLPPSGSGVLSTVTLHAANLGTSALDLTFVSLSDPLAVDIPTQVFDGAVTIDPAPTPTATPTINAADLDGDGLLNSAETNTGLFVSESDTGTDPLDPDTDADTLSDGEEVMTFATNPVVDDTDTDGCADGEETGPNPSQGGGRDPTNGYDFYDVTDRSAVIGSKDKGASGFDLSLLLQYGGTGEGRGPNAAGRDYNADLNGNTIDDGLEMDFAGMSGPASGPDGGISGFDLSDLLQQGGDSCVGPP